MVLEKKRVTYSEYSRLVELPENKGRLLELVAGEVIEKMASFKPSKIGARIGRKVGNFVEEHELGAVTGTDGGDKLSEGSLDGFTVLPGFTLSVREIYS